MKTISFKLEDELADWLDADCARRGKTRTDILLELVEGLREIVVRRYGTDSPPPTASRGVGICPNTVNGEHLWANASEDALRRCIHCQAPGRGPGGHLEAATMARTDLFNGLRAPDSSNGKPKVKA